MKEIIPIPCYICGEMIDTTWVHNGGMLPSEAHELLGDCVCHRECFDRSWEEYEQTSV